MGSVFNELNFGLSGRSMTARAVRAARSLTQSRPELFDMKIGGQGNVKPQRWLTVKEAAAKLKVSRSTVYRMLRAGLLIGKRVKRPRVTRILEASIDDFMNLSPDY
jgi:excisionase family DNA binding protein